MVAIKLCLSVLLALVLHCLVWCAPVFAAQPAPAVVTLPPVLITAKPAQRCYTRPLESVSGGNVRVCHSPSQPR